MQNIIKKGSDAKTNKTRKVEIDSRQICPGTCFLKFQKENQLQEISYHYQEVLFDASDYLHLDTCFYYRSLRCLEIF